MMSWLTHWLKGISSNSICSRFAFWKIQIILCITFCLRRNACVQLGKVSAHWQPEQLDIELRYFVPGPPSTGCPSCRQQFKTISGSMNFFCCPLFCSFFFLVVKCLLFFSSVCAVWPCALITHNSIHQFHFGLTYQKQRCIFTCLGNESTSHCDAD